MRPILGLTHAVSGAAAGAWLAVASTPDPVVALAGVAVAAAAAMTPDLDHPQARAVRALWIAGWALCHLIRFVSRLTTGRAHRGLSHSLAFALLVGAATATGAAVSLPLSHAAHLGLAACLGVLAALLGDLVTRAGLSHLTWPLDIEVSIPKRLRIRTGGVAETYLVLPAVSLAAAVGVAQVVLHHG